MLVIFLLKPTKWPKNAKKMFKKLKISNMQQMRNKSFTVEVSVS